MGFYYCLVTMVRAHPRKALGELQSVLVGRMVRALTEALYGLRYVFCGRMVRSHFQGAPYGLNRPG